MSQPEVHTLTHEDGKMEVVRRPESRREVQTGLVTVTVATALLWLSAWPWLAAPIAAVAGWEARKLTEFDQWLEE